MEEKEETEGGDVDALVDLMESELGTSSQKQDVSARSKFNAFLDRHVSVGMTLRKLKAADVTKVMFGQFLSFVLHDQDVAWQTSMNYVSSIKRQLEVVTGTKLFQSELDWYKRCRRHLSKQYLHVGSIYFSDLHWHDHYILIDITRIKVRQQQSLSIFCSPKCWSIDPFHALASQLVADPYNASPRVFSQITDSRSDSHVAAYMNRLLKSLYAFDQDATITRNLQSHSTRRGGAAFASADPSVNLSDLAHRGLWSMDGFATLLEYISPTSSGDQNIAKVLGGWTDTKQAGMPPTLACFESETYQMCTRVNIIRKRFVSDNILSLSPEQVKQTLTSEQQAQQFAGVRTFADTLERLVIGYQQLSSSNEDLKSMLSRVLDRHEHPHALNHSGAHQTCHCMNPVLQVTTEHSPSLVLRPPIDSSIWPSSLKSLKAKKLSDFLVQFVSEGLGSLPSIPGNRAQKDCLRAITIAEYVMNFKSIPALSTTTDEGEHKR